MYNVSSPKMISVQFIQIYTKNEKFFHMYFGGNVIETEQISEQIIPSDTIRYVEILTDSFDLKKL